MNDSVQSLADALGGVVVRVVITEEEFLKSRLMRPQLICERLRVAGVPTNVDDDMEMFRQIKVERGRLNVGVMSGGGGLEYTWLVP